ncbi:MAG TPA: carboxymuconolactone decarboxylase family protein [Gemmatimonadaceae bacterium]|nr:carboxymuconolactone decarboxylase family protein [Gemmatimonadaceae bacterium]
MTHAAASEATLVALDEPTRALVRLAAALAGAGDDVVREALRVAHDRVSPEWVEELILQTYLFAGFPRALNGMRQWRRLRPSPAAGVETNPDARVAGEATCARVYGSMYDKLRANIRELHPLMDEWMIVEGYGKVLSRPGLDLARRELCIVGACAASGQDRQLQSHLHGARNAGASDRAISAAIESLAGVIPDALRDRALHMWQRVQNDVH